jgi:hypothetical protein
MVAAGAAALALAASVAAGHGSTSHELAVKSCTSLQTSLGEKTFAMTFGTTRHTSAFSACVAQMERTESAVQQSAQSSCSGKKGKAFHQCVLQQTRLQLAARVTSLKNAAVTCKTQLRSMGVSSFVSTFGANHNLANAFGKCVSRAMHGTTTSQPAPAAPTTTTTTPAPTVSTFHVTLNALNGTRARGTAFLRLSGDQLKVDVTLFGLEPNQTHAVFIGGISSGSAACPSSTADTNKDGVVSLGEAQPLFGSSVLDLTPAPTANRHGTISFARVFTVDPSKLTPLTSRTLVVQGMTVGTTYDQTAPVACGVISA